MDDEEYKKARERLVENFIASRGVDDPQVLACMLAVPRHLFVPPSLINEAYKDYPLPIEEGQTISQPYIVAMMTQASELSQHPHSIVLEIGTGSGYQAAILSLLAKEVCTIERIASLGQEAERRLHELKYLNVHVKIGDGTLGWPEKKLFDVIMVTAGAPVVPESLIQQLKIEGRLIIPVGGATGQRLLRIRKISETEITEETLELVRFVPLIGEEGWNPENKD